MKSYLPSKTCAVVAAFNEAPRLGEVLAILCAYGFTNVVVVNDGSTDSTSLVARQYPVLLIENEQNMGKGHAMARGVSATDAEVIFFCDADVKGLTRQVIDEIIKPVVNGQVDMMIGMRNRTIFIMRFLLRVIPLLGGERAVTREFWESVPMEFKERFMVEAALNFFAHRAGGYDYHVFPGLSQTVKERKYGLMRGFIARLRMCWDVFKSQVRLHLHWYRSS